MFKITVEDLDGKIEKQVSIVGNEYAIFGTDPNKEEICFSNINASTIFMMNIKEGISEIVIKSITEKKCADCGKKSDCDKHCTVHTVDLTDASPELAKELYELIQDLKNSGHNPKDPIDLGKMSPEFKEKVMNVMKKMKKTDNPFSALADMIMKSRNKNPFGGSH